MICKDIITVIDQAGTTRGQTRAVVDKNKIYTQDTSLLIEEGDTIERDLPHGRGRKNFLPNMSSSTEPLARAGNSTKSRQGNRTPSPIDLVSVESRSMSTTAHTLA